MKAVGGQDLCSFLHLSSLRPLTTTVTSLCHAWSSKHSVPNTHTSKNFLALKDLLIVDSSSFSSRAHISLYKINLKISVTAIMIHGPAATGSLKVLLKCRLSGPTCGAIHSGSALWQGLRRFTCSLKLENLCYNGSTCTKII